MHHQEKTIPKIKEKKEEELTTDNFVNKSSTGPLFQKTLSLNCCVQERKIQRKKTSCIFQKSKVKSLGRFYLPPFRNINALFLKDFLVGKKRLLKIEQVRFLPRAFNFRELSLEKLINSLSNPNDALLYLPSNVPYHKLDRSYSLNVIYKDSQHD